MFNHHIRADTDAPVRRDWGGNMHSGVYIIRRRKRCVWGVSRNALRNVAQFGRAPDLGSGGCRFKSGRSGLRSGGIRRKDGQETGIRINTLGVVPMGSNPSNLGSIRPVKVQIFPTQSTSFKCLVVVKFKTGAWKWRWRSMLKRTSRGKVS